MHSILMDLQGRLQFEILEKKNCARVFRLDDASVKGGGSTMQCWSGGKKKVSVLGRGRIVNICRICLVF